MFSIFLYCFQIFQYHFIFIRLFIPIFIFFIILRFPYTTLIMKCGRITFDAKNTTHQPSARCTLSAQKMKIRVAYSVNNFVNYMSQIKIPTLNFDQKKNTYIEWSFFFWDNNEPFPDFRVAVLQFQSLFHLTDQ